LSVRHSEGRAQEQSEMPGTYGHRSVGSWVYQPSGVTQE
jgi:hypothetical protein